MLMFTLGKGNRIRNFLFISNIEADVPELFLVASCANMAKYGSLSSSLHFHRVFLFVCVALSTNLLLHEGTPDWKSYV